MNPLRRNPRELNAFLIASLINTTGGSLMWPLVSMYVFDELGRSLADAGLAILAQSLGGIIGQLLGGALYHRVGVKRLVTGSLALNAFILLLLPLISGNWTLFIAAMWLVGLFNSMSSPAIQSYIGFRFTERRAEIFNTIYVANNIGVALGTALSGFLADISYRLSFIANGATSAFFAVFFLFYLKQTVIPGEAATASVQQHGKAASPGAWALLSNARLYLLMATGTLLLHLGNSIWNTGVSPFIVGEGMPKKYYGFLWTLNGLLIFLGQPVLAAIKRYLTRTVSAQMTASSLFYAAGYACILLTQSYPGMVLGMILATLGEMLISPAIPAYLSEHGGKHAPFYIGLAGGIGSGGRVIGPYVMGSLYDAGGLPPVAWLALAAALASTAAYWAHSAWNRQAAEQTKPVPAGETRLTG